MSFAYYGTIIPSSLFVTRIAYAQMDSILDTSNYKKEENILTEKEKVKFNDILRYKEWSREKLLKELIEFLSNWNPKYSKLIEMCKCLDNLDEIQLENMLLNSLWNSLKFSDAECHRISEGKYIFVGYPINNMNKLLPISKSVDKEDIKLLREELDMWNFNDFEIDFYSGPIIYFSTEIDEENKDKLK